MAEKKNRDAYKFMFKSFKLFKDQSLGTGSYGAVYKAKCDDLLCAAKVIHPTLIDPQNAVLYQHQLSLQREHRLPIRRFEQEFEFMNALRHPNIVLCLGMVTVTNTHSPVLLMELMDQSLTNFVESSQQSIPYHIQIDICHDIALALSYLHSNNIIHRDLSSNNVLLSSNLLAKVTDFGMAILRDINPQTSHFTNTLCPGTDVYMPPEAVHENPTYTEKLDSFSFGVLMVQILTRQFPKPGDRMQEVQLNNPEIKIKGKIFMLVPEISRRQNHIHQIDPTHPLLPIIFDCLKDEEIDRPSAHQLCEVLEDLKSSAKYTESTTGAEKGEDEEHKIQEALHIVEKRTSELSLKEDKVQQLEIQLRENDQRFRKREREKDKIIMQLQDRERQLNQQLEESKKVLANFSRRVVDPEQRLVLTSHAIVLEGQQSKSALLQKKETGLELKWRTAKRAPCSMYRNSDAVVDGNTVYIRRQGTVEIYSFDVRSDCWSQLPHCRRTDGSLAVINGWLTTIGGDGSDELFSLN